MNEKIKDKKDKPTIEDDCAEMDNALQDLKILTRDVEDFKKARNLNKTIKEYDRDYKQFCTDKSDTTD